MTSGKLIVPEMYLTSVTVQDNFSYSPVKYYVTNYWRHFWHIKNSGGQITLSGLLKRCTDLPCFCLNDKLWYDIKITDNTGYSPSYIMLYRNAKCVNTNVTSEKFEDAFILKGSLIFQYSFKLRVSSTTENVDAIIH
jgi:hypothetical protein